MNNDGEFQVWRGKEILSMDSRLVDLGGLITNSGEVGREQLTHLLHNLQLHSKYAQSDCVNSFHADKKIQLKGCSFFGPLPLKIGQQGSSVEYKITLRLEMVWHSINSLELKTRAVAEVFRKITVEMEDNAHNITIIPVDFDSPVEIDPNALKYNLIFRLEGPPTYELDPTKFESHITSHGVNFFFWPGSKQMPFLKFVQC